MINYRLAAFFQEAQQGDPDASTAPCPLFEVVLAGDVLYKHDLVAPFIRTLGAVLAPDGAAYLCHLPRAGVTQAEVTRALSLAGFAFEECAVQADRVIDEADCTAEDAKAARLYRIKRRRPTASSASSS
jgi:hypothetical protein